MNTTDVIARIQKKAREELVELEKSLKELEYSKQYVRETAPDTPFYRKALEQIEKRIKATKKDITSNKQLLLPMNEYVAVLKDYNKESISECIKEAYVFDLGHKLGKIKIIKRKTKLKRVDWLASNKYKERLLKEGKQLWDKETKTGIKWIIYHNDPYSFQFRWLRHSRRYRCAYGWHMRFSKGPNGLTTTALRYFKENPLSTLKHKLYERKANLV